ncbi:thioesterase II [Coprinopsis cinerea okayama7|uniref:Thioesterase II n=1 Tax=Coprinopsis cinerea (strain Okayama-7 / 130 / ATCC MYA-4618 / FGSC 9003) TaxID=240176 RepID=A8N0K2_COPC7|nr:thioesterase II [Coprinopsis cinerea okayama7\|eukprot:XP_001828452.2 thioesterase II [Coprinopsis cinerea okayama7\
MAETDQVEHEQISTSLEVEKIDVNLFRSKSLWLPLRARGVFGGASPATPIIYSVERIRDGKSYVTRSVKAIQNGQIIFMMLCSFQKPEALQPNHQWPMPQAPPPEECEYQEEKYRRLIAQNGDGMSPKVKELYEAIAYERSRSPVAIKVALEHDVSADGIVRYMYWMRARSIPKYDAPFQKCILGYASDLQFIGTASRVVGLRRGAKEGQNRLGMMSTLDHTLWFYNNDFDFGDWVLYVAHDVVQIDCPAVGSGRAVVTGRIYTRDGKLIAVAAQEGVMRADVRPPKQDAKL